MTKVHSLSYLSDDGWNGEDTVINLFATRELAEARIVREVLAGRVLRNVKLAELVVEGSDELPENSPLRFPAVVEAIKAGKKIQAIKELRFAVVGMGLREAKDAVEAVWNEVPQNPPSPIAPVQDWRWDSYLRDSDDDVWVHVGEGKYRLLNRARTDWLDPQSDRSLTYSEIDDMHSVEDQWNEGGLFAF